MRNLRLSLMAKIFVEMQIPETGASDSEVSGMGPRICIYCKVPKMIPMQPDLQTSFD